MSSSFSGSFAIATASVAPSGLIYYLNDRIRFHFPLQAKRTASKVVSPPRKGKPAKPSVYNPQTLSWILTYPLPRPWWSGIIEWLLGIVFDLCTPAKVMMRERDSNELRVIRAAHRASSTPRESNAGSTGAMRQPL